MTDESSPTSDPSRSLPEPILDALRAAIEAHLHHTDADSTRLGDALRSLTREARARGARPEHLIVALKHSWSALPELQHAVDRQARSRLLERLITLCIEAYYAE